MSDEHRNSNGGEVGKTASINSRSSRHSQNGVFSAPMKRVSSIGTKSYRKSWYDPALTDPKWAYMSLSKLLAKDWAMYLFLLAFCVIWTAIQALFQNIKHSKHCDWITDPMVWQIDFLLFIAVPSMTSLMFSLKFFEREEFAFSFKEYACIWVCGLSSITLLNIVAYSSMRRDKPDIFWTAMLTVIFIICCVIRVKRAKVNAPNEKTFKDCKKIVMHHFFGIALVNVSASSSTGFPLLTDRGFGFVRAKVNTALGCLILPSGDVKCDCQDEAGKLVAEKCADGGFSLVLLNVFNVMFVTLFFSLVIPVFCLIMGQKLFDPMGRLMCGNIKTKDDTVLMKRNRFWLNTGFDGFRFLFGRGLMLSLGSTELFIIFLIKDLFYHFFHFGLKFHTYTMEFTIATFHPELDIKDKFFKAIAKAIELTVRFMGIPKKIARAWTIPFDYNTVLVEKGLQPVLPDDEVDIQDDADGNPVVRKMSTESIETSIALSFCNTAVVVYNFPRKVEGILQRGRSVHISASQDLMSAQEMYKEELQEIDQSQLDEFTSFIQTQIFLRYQARALAKLSTSIPFLLVPYLGSMGNGRNLHSFNDMLGMLSPADNLAPAPVDATMASRFQRNGLFFLITDVAEYLLLMLIQFRFAIDYRLLLAQFHRVLSHGPTYGILMILSAYLVAKKYNELNWPFKLDRVNEYLERERLEIVTNPAGAAPYDVNPFRTIQPIAANSTWNAGTHGAAEWTHVTEACFGYAPKP